MLFSSRVRLRCADGGELFLQTPLDWSCLPVLSDIRGTQADPVRCYVAFHVEDLFDLQKTDTRCFLNQDSIRPREARAFNIHRANGSDPVCHGDTEVEAPSSLIRTFETRVADTLFAVQLAPDL